MTILERETESWGVATIVEKMVETKVRWFIHVERRPRKTIEELSRKI
jgi:hypothetical protein